MTLRIVGRTGRGDHEAVPERHVVGQVTISARTGDLRGGLGSGFVRARAGPSLSFPAHRAELEDDLGW